MIAGLHMEEAVTSIIKDVSLDVAPETAWAALRDPGTAHKAFPGVLTACRLDGDVRTVTFAGGLVVRELIVDVDDARRRIAYAAIEGRFRHHHASMQVVARGDSRSSLVWVSDFLPNEHEALVRGLVEQGSEAFRRTLEANR